MEEELNFKKLMEARDLKYNRRTAEAKEKYEAKKATLEKEIEVLKEEYGRKCSEVSSDLIVEENEAVLTATEYRRTHRTLEEKKRDMEFHIEMIAYEMDNNDLRYLEGIRKAIFNP